MNRILSLVRRCVEDYEMIAPNDRIAVGVSGGKDSLMLLMALAKLREFYPIPFQVEAFTLDMGHADGRPGMDFAPVARLCRTGMSPLLCWRVRSTTSFLMCAGRRIPAPCVPKCAGERCTAH